jgi:hypothetical protein
MSSRLFKRKTQLIIGKIGSQGVQIEGLRFSFEIEMTDNKETNKGTIGIYNLSEETKGLLEQKDSSIILSLGYDDDELSTLFIGNVVKYKDRYDGVDVITEITCSDGYIALTQKKLSLSFAPGSTTQQIIKRIVAELNLTKGDYDALPNYVYEQGFSCIGTPGTILNTVLARIDYEWTIVNNVLIISKNNETNKKTIMQFLSPSTGLLDKPSRFKEQHVKTKVDKNKLMNGWQIKSLIIPSIQPKSLIQVESDSVNGIFLVKEVKFSGDTHDNDWTAEIDALQK